MEKGRATPLPPGWMSPQTMANSTGKLKEWLSWKFPKRQSGFFSKVLVLGIYCNHNQKKRQNSSCIFRGGTSWGRKCWLLFTSLCDRNNVWFCSVTFPYTSFGNHNSPGIYSDCCLPSPATQEGRDVKFILPLGLERCISLFRNCCVFLTQNFCVAGAAGEDWGRRRKTHVNCRNITHLGCRPTASWPHLSRASCLGDHQEITSKTRCRRSWVLPNVWQWNIQSFCQHWWAKAANWKSTSLS